MRRLLSSVAVLLLSNAVLLSGAGAQEATDTKKKKPAQGQAEQPIELDPVFVLGTLPSQASNSDIGGQSISRSTVTATDIQKSNRNTLDDALATTPGVEVSNTGGSRNERLIYIRGFDRFQVPLYIDGVRVYLPADNRIDFGRFLTPDLAEIQVQKGYVSVLSGPGGMGGAINLVTRKPTKAYEGELRQGIDAGNTGALAGFTTSGSVGIKQDHFYLMANGSYRTSNGWFLPRSFDPVSIGAGGPIEKGGRRNFTNVKDWRANFKLGFTPNDTDEYVVSYTRQGGEKAAPYSIYEPVRGITPMPLPPGTAYQRDWEWPYWNISSLAFNSKTAIGEASYIKTRAYYNTFDNLLQAYDDYSHTTQTTTRSFDSYYRDHAYGFSLEGGTDLIAMNTLKAAIHFRRDVHQERQHNRPGVSDVMEPWQRTSEDTWSFAVEDTFHATDKLDFVAGVSYDLNDIKRAQDYNTTLGRFDYPTGGSHAFNWQLASIYRQSEASQFHASVSSRSRFPTLFERFSTRFGDALPNPSLKPERAINYEIGWAGKPLEGVQLGGSVFYSDLKNVIQSVSIGGNKIQNQNVGDGRTYGVELYGEWAPRSDLTLGARYTYLKRRLMDPQRPGLQPVGTPGNIAYLYVEWLPWDNFTVRPSLELYSSRWSTDRLENNFFKTEGFALANLNVSYKASQNLQFDAGIRNIFDTDYQLAYGFPEPGRNFFVSMTATF
ncbi:TonB-dependent receptor plug domain-containing protein [Labrys sp. KB_33_2]|uniref:TonB-dependent receptor plug domain-containing protein n=1 Tax=Labrys sp. KB_33_2 TaxID=3237479 RepID=UPI003F8F9CEE